jgi:glycogen debranching enzyme
MNIIQEKDNGRHNLIIKFITDVQVCSIRRLCSLAVLCAAVIAALTCMLEAGDVEMHGGSIMQLKKGRTVDTDGGSAETRERWELRVPAGSSREFIYTNKVATHFSGEAAGEHSRSYHGLFCAMHEYLDSWELHVEGMRLGAGTVKESMCYPHTIYRLHSDPEITEEIFLPDFENGLIVRFSGDMAEGCTLIPWVDMRFIWDVPKPEYRIFWEDKNNMLLISRVDNPFPKGRPRWIAVTADRQLAFSADERSRAVDYPKDAARRAMGRTYPFSPGKLAFACESGKQGSIVFGFGLGVNENEAAAQALKLVREFSRLKRKKYDRIEGLFERADIETENVDFNKALRWARVSMDNLIMNQRGKGIYAGFHWFPNYWGRDSFICLPGACLATGAYEDAREIILSFMEHQQVDPSVRYLGRFPNIVNPDDLQYAGVDGTWWLVRAAWKYALSTGDIKFIVKGFPRIRLAIEGALSTAVDELGFLTHGDGETWMDAGGERNPYSPRGDRAVEVQALFHHGLLAGAAWARELSATLRSGAAAPGGSAAGNNEAAVGREAAAGGKENAAGENHSTTGDALTTASLDEPLDERTLDALASRWEEKAKLLRENFVRFFWNEHGGYLYDHLNRDGTADDQIRPNAILALWVSLDSRDVARAGGNSAARHGGRSTVLLDADKARRLVETAQREILLPHGVASLSPNDPRFHRSHLNLDRYYYDEAYHNGDVWEWLAGPMVSCLLFAGKTADAWRCTGTLVNEILREACVGSLREIQDGAHTPGKEEFGGATSQAWSLAEFIRVSMTEFLYLTESDGMWDVHARMESVEQSKPSRAWYRYIGIGDWISSGFVPDRDRIPVQWGATRYKLPFMECGSAGITVDGCRLIVLEGSVEAFRPSE